MTDLPEAPHPHDVADLAALAEKAPAAKGGRLRTLVFVGENVLVLALLAWWLIWGRHGHVNGYLVVFLYCFPSEFLVAPVPHEPVLVYFGKILGPGHVALVSVFGTLITEAINYHTFKYVSDARFLRRVLDSPLVSKAVSLFDRRPFVAILVGALAPIPFYPFRFLVVLARYPLSRFLLAVFLARLPRFYLLALLGQVIPVSDHIYLGLFAVLVLVGVAPFIPFGSLTARVRGLFGRKAPERQDERSPEPPPTAQQDDGEIGEPLSQC